MKLAPRGRVWEETERVPIGIEHHPDIILGLMFRLSGTAFDGERHGCLEIVGGDIEVDHH